MIRPARILKPLLEFRVPPSSDVVYLNRRSLTYSIVLSVESDSVSLEWVYNVVSSHGLVADILILKPSGEEKNEHIHVAHLENYVQKVYQNVFDEYIEIHTPPIDQNATLRGNEDLESNMNSPDKNQTTFFLNPRVQNTTQYCTLLHPDLKPKIPPPNSRNRTGTSRRAPIYSSATSAGAEEKTVIQIESPAISTPPRRVRYVVRFFSQAEAQGVVNTFQYAHVDGVVVTCRFWYPASNTTVASESSPDTSNLSHEYYSVIETTRVANYFLGYSGWSTAISSMEPIEPVRISDFIGSILDQLLYLFAHFC